MSSTPRSDDVNDLDGRKYYSPVSTEGLMELMSNPASVRNFALAGNLHHGKTTFMDMLIEDTHVIYTLNKRYMDTRADEQEAKISIKAVPISLVLGDSNNKLFLCNIMDTPGHIDFSDEVNAALRLADGVVLIVDAVEGVSMNTRREICHAIEDGLPIVVVLNKVDKLITELDLPQKSAYNKLLHTIKLINASIALASPTDSNIQVIDPAKGNVCFASASAGWSFTLQSFAKLYVERTGIPLDAHEFAANLWGDLFFDSVTRSFDNKQPGRGAEKSFISFILNPLYKIYSHDGEQERIKAALDELGVTLIQNWNLSRSVHYMLRLACNSVFGTSKGFADMVVQHIPSAKDSAPQKVRHFYTGPTDSKVFRAMEACDASGPLMVNITKLYPNSDCSAFDAFGRVYSGEIRIGQTLHVLGEGCHADDKDEIKKVVTKLWIYQSRYRVPVTKAPAGSWVLIEGLDSSIMKTATLCSLKPENVIYTFSPLKFNIPVLVKTSIEPLKPSDLTKIINGLKKVSKSYPLSIVEVENSGKMCTVSGIGELYLDCMINDLKEICAQTEIKVTDYAVHFCETVTANTVYRGGAESPNKKNQIVMIANQFRMGHGDDIGLNKKVTWSWKGVHEEVIYKHKDSILKGLQWAAKEGPLRGEAIENVEFAVSEVTIAPEESDCKPFEITTATRCAAHASFLNASPILMEPVYRVEIQTPLVYVETIIKILAQRRGQLIFSTENLANLERTLTDERILYKYKAVLPVSCSFGFEKELGRCTQEKALCDMVFDRWEKLPEVQSSSYQLLDARQGMKQV